MDLTHKRLRRVCRGDRPDSCVRHYVFIRDLTQNPDCNDDFLTLCSVPCMFLCSMFLVPVPFLVHSLVIIVGVWSALNLDSSRISGDNWTNLTNPSEYTYSSVS